MSHFTPFSLIGLLALADLDMLARRTAFGVTSSWLDTLVLCPGLHRQHKAANLNKGEYPACAAMTTGYVFRIENPATVFYLQSVSETGKLTNVSVSKAVSQLQEGAHLLYLAVGSLAWALYFLSSLGDWWALSYLFALVLVRFVNTALIRA